MEINMVRIILKKVVNYPFVWFLLLGCLIILLNGNWMYNAPECSDIDEYLGMSLDFPDLIMKINQLYYKTERLPGIIIGAVFYKLFPSFIANIFLDLFLYILCATTLYSILKHTINERAAIFTTVAMAFYPDFLGAIGDDYVDGKIVTFYLLSLYAVTRIIKSISCKQLIWCFIAGFLFSSMVICHPASSPLAVVLVLYLLMGHTVEGKRHSLTVICKVLFWTVIGFLSSILVFATIHYYLKGDFFLFRATIPALIDLQASNPFKLTGYAWLDMVKWIVFPFAIGLISLVTLVISQVRRSKLSSERLTYSQVFQILLLVHLVTIFILDLMGANILPHFARFDFVVPVLFLAIGSLVNTKLSQLSLKQFKIVIFAFLIGSSFIIYIAAYFPVLPYAQYADFGNCYFMVHNLRFASIYASPGLLGLFLLVLNTWRKKWFIVFPLLSILWINYVCFNDLLLDRPEKKEIFLSQSKWRDMMDELDPKREIYPWYHWGEFGSYKPLKPLYSAFVNSSHFFRQLGISFPDLNLYPPYYTTFSTQGGKIFILSTDKYAFEKGHNAFLKYNLKLELITVKTFSHRNITFPIYICQVLPIKIVSVDSSNMDDFNAGVIFDKNIETFWETDRPFPHWIEFNFGEERKIEAYTLQTGKHENDSTYGMPKDWKFQGSNNGSNWTVIDTRTNQTMWKNDNEKAIYKMPNSASYKYYRLYITNGNAQNLRLHELEIIEKDKSRIMKVWADSETSGPVKNLFDRDFFTFWETSGPFPHWAVLDLDEEVKRNTYSLQTGSHGFESTGRMPKSWQFQGSNDALNWTILDKRNNETWREGEKRTYVFSNTTPYRYYRLFVTECIHPSIVRLYKLEILENI